MTHEISRGPNSEVLPLTEPGSCSYWQGLLIRRNRAGQWAGGQDPNSIDNVGDDEDDPLTDLMDSD
jgi:hypothetical protein